MKQLILGGARSGKSTLAEKNSLTTGKRCIYLATATPDDSEMSARIQLHKEQRSDVWLLEEESLDVSSVLAKYNEEQFCVLVDCLTLWLSNCLHQNNWLIKRQLFLEQLERQKSDVIMVSNEVGSGVVPLGELSREFVDESGRLHQQLAASCDSVTLVVAGLPLELKPPRFSDL